MVVVVARIAVAGIVTRVVGGTAGGPVGALATATVMPTPATTAAPATAIAWRRWDRERAVLCSGQRNPAAVSVRQLAQ